MAMLTTTTAACQPKNVWVVEDDRIYREVLCSGLQDSMPGAKIRHFPTEAKVYAALDAIEAGGESKPDLVICDVMLPYKFPGENEFPDPEEGIKRLGDDAFRSAGIRLWKRIRDSRSVSSVPFIYHSVLRKKTMDFDRNKDAMTYYVGKDQTFDELIEVKDSIFAEIDSKWGSSDDEESAFLGRSPEMKRRLIAALAVSLDQCLHDLG